MGSYWFDVGFLCAQLVLVFVAACMLLGLCYYMCRAIYQIIRTILGADEYGVTTPTFRGIANLNAVINSDSRWHLWAMEC